MKSHKTANYGDKSLTMLGPKVWNQLPKNIKSESCFSIFKEYIDTWIGLKYKCNTALWHNLWKWRSKWWKQLSSGSFSKDAGWWNEMPLYEDDFLVSCFDSSAIKTFNIFKAFILYFVCFYLALIPFYTVRSVHFCKRLTFFPKINKDFIHS